MVRGVFAQEVLNLVALDNMDPGSHLFPTDLLLDFENLDPRVSFHSPEDDVELIHSQIYPSTAFILLTPFATASSFIILNLPSSPVFET